MEKPDLSQVPGIGLRRRHGVFFIGPGQDPSQLFGVIQQDWDETRHGPLVEWGGQVGSITYALVEALAEYDAVLADIRDENPNVYYEIAVAHAFDTPVIPLVKSGKTPLFDIHDQAAIVVEADGDSIKNEAALRHTVGKRLAGLTTRGFRTPITSYRERLAADNAVRASAHRRTLPLDGWEYLARQDLLAPLVADNARAGRYVYHLAYGVGEIVDCGPSDALPPELRVVFTSGPRTLVLPDDRAYLTKPAASTP